MNIRRVLLAATLTVLLPVPVLAQGAAPAETQLQMETKRRRVIVRPPTPMEAVERDVDTATAQVEERRRQQSIVRELTRPAPRAPQQDDDLKGGIQTRTLNELRRRR